MINTVLLRGYRLCILVAVIFLIRHHHMVVNRRADRPVTVEEVAEFIKDADHLKTDFSDRAGFHVLDKSENIVGYALRTSPKSDFLIGYCGSTDVLIVLNKDDRVSGFQIRSSGDTTRHVKDVRDTEYFMSILNDKSWDQIAQLNLEEEEIDGVSGATMTSINVIESIRYRFQHSLDQAAKRPSVHWKTEDWCILLIVAASLFLTFSKYRRTKQIRLIFHLLIFVYLGLFYGNMISIGLMMGWSAAGIPWHLSSGIALLLTASLLVPWTSRRPFYCTQVCPHGLAQQWLGQLPVKKRKISEKWNRILRTLPFLLLFYAFVIQFLEIPVDLADLEAFNAYTFSYSGWASIVLAIIGLIASVFYRQPYCRYGCPTGAILSFVRSHGRADRFQRKDWIALILLIMISILYWNSQDLTNWIYH